MFFHHYGIISGSFAVEILPAVLWNLYSTAPLEKFDEKGVYLKKKNYHLRTWKQNFDGSFSQFFQLGCQNCIIRVHEFDEKQLFKKSILFWSFSDKGQNTFGLLAFSFQLGCQNCLLRVRSNVLRRKNERILIFAPFSVFAWNFFGLLSNFFQRGSQNCIYGVQ